MGTRAVRAGKINSVQLCPFAPENGWPAATYDRATDVQIKWRIARCADAHAKHRAYKDYGCDMQRRTEVDGPFATQ